MKKIVRKFSALVGLGFLCVLPVQAFPTLPTLWTYQKLISPSDLPAPASGTQVTSLYSPSVVLVNGVHHMFFGASVSCQNGSVARDTIGHAVSLDGVSNWIFTGYVISPSNDACTVPLANWYTGLLYQVNDPTVIFQGGYFYVTYTGVKHNDPLAGFECGRLGTAVFDGAMNLIYRNDDYLVGGCIPTYGFRGYSRPVYRKTAPGTYELWFDSNGLVGKIPVTSVNSLSPSNASAIYQAGTSNLLSALDIDVVDSSTGVTYVLTNGASGLQISGGSGSSFGTFSSFTQLSGQSPAWDNLGQGSANYFVNLADCATRVYLSGTTTAGKMSIGVATPLNGDMVQQVCDARRAIQ